MWLAHYHFDRWIVNYNGINFRAAQQSWKTKKLSCSITNEILKLRFADVLKKIAYHGLMKDSASQYRVYWFNLWQIFLPLSCGSQMAVTSWKTHVLPNLVTISKDANRNNDRMIMKVMNEMLPFYLLCTLNSYVLLI